MVAICIHSFLLLLRHVTEYSTAAAAGSDEAGRLVEGLLQVLLQRDLRVKEAAGLADLAIGKVCDDPGDELDNLRMAVAVATVVVVAVAGVVHMW